MFFVFATTQQDLVKAGQLACQSASKNFSNPAALYIALKQITRKANRFWQPKLWRLNSRIDIWRTGSTASQTNMRLPMEHKALFMPRNSSKWHQCPTSTDSKLTWHQLAIWSCFILVCTSNMRWWSKRPHIHKYNFVGWWILKRSKGSSVVCVQTSLYCSVLVFCFWAMITIKVVSGVA